MTDDLVGRLREIGRDGTWSANCKNPHPVTVEAAARIEALEAALRKVIGECDRMRNGTDDWFDLVELSMCARAALTPEPPHAD